MKQLTCEMCGSTDLMKQDGVFVCQSCGCKYSIEEARKMMVEGTVDVSGSTVKIDISEKIENYLLMARNAYDADNKLEAEIYCNKIIEAEPNNYEAWLLKGCAAGWQSTLANPRLDEAANCFTQAMDNAPEDKLREVKSKVASEATELTGALIRLSCDHFADFPTRENVIQVTNAASTMLKIVSTLLIKCGVEIEYLNKSVATIISNAAMDAWNNKIYPEYAGEDHPSEFIWERFFERGECVIILLELSIAFSENNDMANAVRYSNLISVQTKICDSASYTYSSSMSDWQIEHVLNDNAKNSRIQRILQWHAEWNKIEPTHIVPDTETVNQEVNARVKAESESNIFACVAVVIIMIVAAILAFME